MEEDLILTPVPSLVAILIAKEREKGAPLTRDEVEKFRDQAECIAMPADARKKVDDARGYLDIDPERAWEEWQIARLELMNNQTAFATGAPARNLPSFMRNHALVVMVALLGFALAAWAAIPTEGFQTAFRFFVFPFEGPAFLFSAVVAIHFILQQRRYRALWLILAGPIIYYMGGLLAFSEGFPLDASFIAVTVTAWAYLATIKLLLLRSCSWRLVFGWGSLSAISAMPFLYSIRSLGEGALGGLWFWGLHILLWYVAVAFAIEKMVSHPPGAVQQPDTRL